MSRRWHGAAWLVGGLMAVALPAGCNALLDIDHIEFGDEPAGGAGGGAGGGGTTGTGAGGTAGGGGGVGGGAVENCHNGTDDNADGLIDCADPQCGSYRCVEPAPSGWSGPAVYHQGQSAESCGGLWPAEAVSGGAGSLDAPPASCSGCSCGAPSGQSCPDGDLAFWLQGTCPGLADQVMPSLPSNTCVPVTGATSDYQGVTAVSVTPAGGQCNPSGGNPTLPPASFADAAVACEGASTGAGCSGSEVCAPLPAAPFDQALCVYQTGDHGCPPPFTDKHSLWQSIADSRDCSQCSCSPPSGGSCSSTAEIYLGVTNSACSGAATVVPHDDSCQAVASPGSVKFLPGNASGGGCNKGGGSPTGNATGSGRVTVCCTP